MGPNDHEEGCGGKFRWNPFVDMDFLMHPGRGRNLGLLICGRVDFFFSWTREKGESREPHGSILGLEYPNALLCLLAALQCYTHSAIALHSSPVGNMAEAGKLEAAQGKYYSLFFFWGWSTSLYVWIWLDIFFSPGKTACLHLEFV